MRVFVITLWMALFASTANAAEVCHFSGTVHDSSNAVVAGAAVQSGGTLVQTDSSGRFSLDGDCGSDVIVRASGFAESRVARPKRDQPLIVILKVSRIEDRISVEADGGAAENSTFDSEELKNNASVALDSKLREVPGFSLFRRTPQLVSEPHYPGNFASWRRSERCKSRIGPARWNSAERSVWRMDLLGRVTPGNDRDAEVAEVSASNLYGSDAVGGVVNLLRPTATTHATVESSVGNLFTPSASGLGGVSFGAWNVGAVADGFRTNGYVPVPPDLRGPVDTVTSSKHTNGGLTLEHSTERGRAFVEGGIDGEVAAEWHRFADELRDSARIECWRRLDQREPRRLECARVRRHGRPATDIYFYRCYENHGVADARSDGSGGAGGSQPFVVQGCGTQFAGRGRGISLGGRRELRMGVHRRKSDVDHAIGRRTAT